MVKKEDKSGIILFDGVCNVCNQAVDFLLKHDQKEYYQFASLQSELGRELKKRYHIDENVDSIIVIEEGNVYLYSDAVLKIIPKLTWKWRLFSIGRIVPKSMRNTIYKQIAKHRYRLFGKRDTCRLPTKKERERFLS
ncbi:thiol-disulfide oxidoreductase DCC family protein [Bacillus sp. FJAT-45037]|uniref:thiol-disulfide oxidoreductase DCC family protein n=1 Tax=Bacillus sp. FJAT-45037 TaxID=2011007 RepID=UPI000C243560|nr:thiol-disulfide oxidoreductase DCC family protein [Bacillus sp. FJAT-45037]